MHRRRSSVDKAVWFGFERKAPRRRATGRNARSGNAAIGGETDRIVDAISTAMHYRRPNLLGQLLCWSGGAGQLGVAGSGEPS